MADTSVKLSGTYDSIEAYNILEEMRNMSSDYEEIRTEAAAAASAATAAVTTAQTAANSASTDAGNAQTYAENANTSAGEAAGYASDASTAATNAASSETNAHNSEVAAAASASSAAASEAVVAGALPLSGGTMTGDIEFYDDLYLGSPIGPDSTEKTKFAGLYSNKNNPHQYGGIGFVNEQMGDIKPQANISAGDGTNRNHFIIYGDAEGGVKYNGGSLTDGTFITARSVNTAANPSVGVSITAPTVNGYQFVCWVSSASNNTIVASYINPATSQTSNLWYIGSIGSNVTFTATALYVRKW